ncbi:MAG TPA: NAD(P)/FAD-dependent oxidoreductase [Methanocorpusculum sp.]|nr:NAD(P)/FAD-dependent oxidoreductase [Methanocorpusculum sp.]
MYDIIVAGAGPVGSAAAKYCADAGLSILVLEEHGTIGHPVQCAGLLSNSAFTECGVTQDSVLNTATGASIIDSRGKALTFDTNETKACIVDRQALDFEMAEAAAAAGAKYQLKTCITRVNPAKQIIHTAAGDEIPYKLLIAADGPRSVIARAYNIPPSKYIYAGIQAEVPRDGAANLVELHPNAAPEFFAWVVPTAENRARIGLLGTHDVPALFSAFSKKFAPSNLHSVTGTVPVGIREKTCGPGMLLAGDAAGFLKPTSGGGIYTGVRSARHAAATAVAACEADNYTNLFLSRYETMWRDDFGRELTWGLAALKLRRSLRTDEVDSCLAALNTPEVIEKIKTKGDMDRPSELLKTLVMHPGVVKTIGLTGVRGLLRTILD